jgi:hypothetical protein
MSSVSGPTSSITTATSNILSTATTKAIDRSDPYDSISTAMLYNSSVTSISTNSEADDESSSSFLASQGTLYDTSSPPSLYLSPGVFHFPDSVSTNSSITNFNTSIIPYMGTSPFASSNNSSSSLDLSIKCPVVASSSQDHLDAAFSSRSISNDAIIQTIQNVSVVPSMSGLSSTKPIHSPQSLHRHQRSHSFTSSSLSPCVSQEQGVYDHREVPLTRKSSIASITSISSDGSSNCSEITTPSTQFDQSDILANVAVSRRGSHLLLTVEQVDEMIGRIKELQKDEWILVLRDESRELQWKRAVTEKDKKIVALVGRTDMLEHSLNVSSKQSKSLWAQLFAAENQYFNDLAVKHAKYQIHIEKLNKDLSAAKNQSTQIQQELNTEKSKIEKLLKEVETIFGNRLEAYSRSRNSMSSDSQTSSSTSSLSTSSASSDSAPKIESLLERPSSKTESSSSQNPLSSWSCVIC